MTPALSLDETQSEPVIGASTIPNQEPLPDEPGQQDGQEGMQIDGPPESLNPQSEPCSAPLNPPPNPTRVVHLAYKISTSQSDAAHEPTIPVPPIDISFENLSFKNFKERVFDQFRSHQPISHLFQVLVKADASEEIDWNYSISSPLDASRTWSLTTRFNWAFSRFLVAAKCFPSDANISVELRIALPKSDDEPAKLGKHAIPPETSTPDVQPSRTKPTSPARTNPVQNQPTPPTPAPRVIPAEEMPPQELPQEERPPQGLPQEERPPQDLPQEERPPRDMSILDFMEFCHIPRDDTYVLALFTLHQIHHWSVFERVSEERLLTLGFPVGTARHLTMGVAEHLTTRTHIPTHAPDLPRENMTMAEFLRFCHIPPDDKHTQAQITFHEICHWTVFQYMSEDELLRLGFAFGPSRLITRGVAEARRKLRRNRSPSFDHFMG
ncbi:uncharacterized protein PGTG_19840 [Puccinia graminis f. sp. tritici CRL 75-36-700-3]|uniref:SAM domain-containing protein n=1 Tax=Puccinia graminis f. sp. tritici (strain CRL 75-36-700-3 / race SCCL) TaxID=418459 RepID=E3LB70_PUCGT|nr:uncharacterized protein PGTG_19840 [Puccinia graminis f. sp. tritici CRL 75-36-700-3]EFP93795.1 hypothetical protein PGTG_19840 [Puccinia graminis f. sp. tritici CRL 75-36-700-3]